MNRTRRLMRSALATAVLAAGTAPGIGCVQALHANIGPFEERLHVTGRGADVAFVRVLQSEPVVYRLDSDGRTIAHIPQFGRTCSTYFLFIPVSGQRPENTPVLEVVVPGRSVRRFSIKQLHRIEVSADGFRELRL